MSDPSFPLQVGIETLLQASTGLTDLVGDRIYDQPPLKPTFPYVTLGDCQIVPDKAGCIDGVEAFPIINVWSRATGYPEAKKIAAAVCATLDDHPEALTVTGFNVVVFELENYLPFRDPDGLTRRVALTFHSLIQPA